MEETQQIREKLQGIYSFAQDRFRIQNRILLYSILALITYLSFYDWTDISFAHLAISLIVFLFLPVFIFQIFGVKVPIKMKIHEYNIALSEAKSSVEDLLILRALPSQKDLNKLLLKFPFVGFQLWVEFQSETSLMRFSNGAKFNERLARHFDQFQHKENRSQNLA